MTESSVNTSLLKYQDQVSPKALPQRIKQTNSKSKLPDKIELTQQQQEVINDIYSIITKHLNNPKIKMQQLESLLNRYDLPVRSDMIFQLYTICDQNQDFSLNRKEFSEMFTKPQALSIFEKYARVQKNFSKLFFIQDSIKKRLKKVRQSIQYNGSDIQFSDEALTSSKDRLGLHTFPMSLFGLFFCLAQKLVRNELHDFALNPENKVSDRYDAITNSVKLLNINDQLQQKEGNYDVKLKDRMEKKYLQRLNSNQTTANDNYVQQIESPNSKSQEFFQKVQKQKFPSQDNFKSKISFMVSLAKIKGQADAFLDHINYSGSKEVYTINDSSRIKKNNQNILKLRFPSVEHTFNNETGLIKQQYKYIPQQKEQEQLQSMSQNNLKYCMFQKKKFSTVIPMLSERQSMKQKLPSVQLLQNSQVTENDDNRYTRKNFCFLQKTNVSKAIFDNISAGIKPYRL